MKFLRILFRIFASIVFILIIGVLFLMNLGHDSSEDTKRERMAIQVKSEIEHYYDQNKHYPTSLYLLPVANNKDLISYYKDGIVRYSSAPQKYRLVWVNTGIYGRTGSPHTFSRSGKQCGSDKAALDLMSQDAEPDGHGFFDIDLH